MCHKLVENSHCLLFVDYCPPVPIPIKNRGLKFHKCFQDGIRSGVTHAPKGFNGKGERKCLQPDTQHRVQQIFGPLPRVTIVCALQLHTSISTHSALCTLTTQWSECSFTSANISNKKMHRSTCVCKICIAAGCTHNLLSLQRLTLLLRPSHIFAKLHL